MLDKVRQFAEKYNMLRLGCTVVCGLSGGADSVCMLRAIRELSAEIGFTVEALHVNHCLRGDESDRDEAFCRELCRDLGIPFTAVSCDVKGYSAEKCISCEEAARELRYGIFRRYTEGKLLATAHNADDNLETMLLNLIRGTGLKGMAGIPPVRGNIIRPLLSVSRSEIEQYLKKIGQTYVTDSTNLTDDYTRNKIRHKIIPLMKELNGSLTETSVRTSLVLRSENDLIEAEVDKAMEKCFQGGVFTGLNGHNEVIRNRCISRFLLEKGFPVSRKRLEECGRIAVNGGKLNISGNYYLVSDGTVTELKEILPDTCKDIISRELKIGENNIFPNAKLVCELVNCENLKKSDFVHKNLTSYLLDYDKIIGRAVVRNRKYGDKLRLSGRSFTSSVKKIINETIPVSLRSTLHFIEDEEGTIFGEKIGIADRVSPDESTSRLLKITVEREGMECMI